MKELAKLEELRQEMEKGLDGLDLFVETWEDCGFRLTEGGDVRFINPLEDISSDDERECLERIATEGRAFVAGMKLALDVLAEYLKNRADAEGSGA